MTVAKVAYCAQSDEYLVIPWVCGYPGPLTAGQARDALAEHGEHRPRDCRISRSARRVLARVEPRG